MHVGLRRLRNEAGTGMDAALPVFSSRARQAVEPCATGLTGRQKVPPAVAVACQ